MESKSKILDFQNFVSKYDFLFLLRRYGMNLLQQKDDVKYEAKTCPFCNDIAFAWDDNIMQINSLTGNFICSKCSRQGDIIDLLTPIILQNFSGTKEEALSQISKILNDKGLIK
ncbi:MAG: hypothetical protein M3Q64_01915 [bacterium]|nr:hypothetical protein [bacterium]